MAAYNILEKTVYIHKTRSRTETRLTSRINPSAGVQLRGPVDRRGDAMACFIGLPLPVREVWGSNPVRGFKIGFSVFSCATQIEIYSVKNKFKVKCLENSIVAPNLESDLLKIIILAGGLW